MSSSGCDQQSLPSVLIDSHRPVYCSTPLDLQPAEFAFCVNRHVQTVTDSVFVIFMFVMCCLVELSSCPGGSIGIVHIYVYMLLGRIAKVAQRRWTSLFFYSVELSRDSGGTGELYMLFGRIIQGAQMGCACLLFC